MRYASAEGGLDQPHQSFLCSAACAAQLHLHPLRGARGSLQHRAVGCGAFLGLARCSPSKMRIGQCAPSPCAVQEWHCCHRVVRCLAVDLACGLRGAANCMEPSLRGAAVMLLGPLRGAEDMRSGTDDGHHKVPSLRMRPPFCFFHMFFFLLTLGGPTAPWLSMRMCIRLGGGRSSRFFFPSSFVVYELGAEASLISNRRAQP